MIGTELRGRLGNQMFSYAYARKLIEERGCKDELVLGVRALKRSGFNNQLNDFNVYPYRTTERIIWLETGSLMQRIVAFIFQVEQKIEENIFNRQAYKIEEKWYPILDKFGLRYSRDNKHEFKVNNLPVLMTAGFFENSKFFNSIRPILLKEFTPTGGAIEHNTLLYRKIHETNSVCVSVRRGDYVSNPQNEKIFNICDKAYFYRAMKVIREKVENPVFIFFSDDIGWVRQNIKTDGESYYERGDDPVWEKLRLMYSCKHFIISNSTFSWWAQYLSRNPDKIVVSPTRWYKVNGPSYLIEDSFIKV